MSYILAHDLGTTGNKANLFNESGALIASHTEHYEVSYPHPAWAEQDADAWWRAVAKSTQALLAKMPEAKDAIAAVSFSGQMMGVVPVDVQGNALRSCIIWADQRAVQEADDFVARCGADAIYTSTGHRASAAYTAAKMLWLKRHQPEIYAATHKFLFAKDYCVLKLTSDGIGGEAVTDYSDASGSTLFDLASRRWRADFLDALELDEGKLPDAVASQSVVGSVTQSAAAQTGLHAGTPVVIGGGDGACATIGAGCIEPGEAYCVLGTSSWIAMTTYAPILDAQKRTFTFHNLPANAYMPTGTMQTACASRDWLIRVLGAEVPDDAIARVSAGAQGLMFLPYLIGERSPWWNPKARGAFVGLSMVHDKAEMARAVLEGVAFNLKIILETFKEGGASIPTIRLIGGGAQSQVWQQILADVWNMPIHLPELLSEATSWGAAVAGGVGVGLYPGWEIAKAQTRTGRVVEPNPHNTARYAEHYALFKQTYLALEPVYNKL
jgi:xylulokinase